MARTANNGWEDSPGGVITSKTSFAHAGAIVDNKSSNVLISHFNCFLMFKCSNSKQSVLPTGFKRSVYRVSKYLSFYILLWAKSQNDTQSCKDVSALQITECGHILVRGKRDLGKTIFFQKN